MNEPIDINNNCIMHKARRAARTVTSIYEEAFSELGLTGSQFSILVAVSAAHGAPISQLALKLGMDRTTLSRNLGPLVRRNLLAIKPAKHDGRTRIVALTGEGQECISQALPLWEEAQEKMKGKLGTFNWERTSLALDELGRHREP